MKEFYIGYLDLDFKQTILEHLLSLEIEFAFDELKFYVIMSDQDFNLFRLTSEYPIEQLAEYENYYIARQRKL